MMQIPEQIASIFYDPSIKKQSFRSNPNDFASQFCTIMINFVHFIRLVVESLDYIKLIWFVNSIAWKLSDNFLMRSNRFSSRDQSRQLDHDSRREVNELFAPKNLQSRWAKNPNSSPKPQSRFSQESATLNKSSREKFHCQARAI